MEIRNAKTSDVKPLHEFNSRMFPQKKIDSKRYLDFWLSKSYDAVKYFLLLIDDQGNIVGQNLMSPMTYYYNNNKHHTVWGFDLIIEEEFRKDTWGLDLMIRNKELFPGIFCTGSGPQALGINLKLGMKLLGEIKKYVGIINPFWIFNIFGKKTIPTHKFPTNIKVNNNCFVLLNKSQLPKLNNPFNNNLLEIARDNEYMQWRFFNDLHEYAIYKNIDSDNYFVLRTTFIKHIKVMLLVDYRCDANSSEQFESILCAAKRITSKLHIPFLITGSTLNTFDKVLEQYHFKSIGRHRPVLGYIKCKDRKEDIDNRNFVFVTLADSDGETNWI